MQTGSKSGRQGAYGPQRQCSIWKMAYLIMYREVGPLQVTILDQLDGQTLLLVGAVGFLDAWVS